MKRRIAKRLTRKEAAELRTLPKRAGKNLFGLGAGESRSRMEGQRRKEAHKLLDQGQFRQAKRVSRMSTRRYAKKRGIKLEGRLREKIRHRKERARAKAHGIVDKLFGANPVPALVSSLGAAIEEGAGLAAGSAIGTRAFKDVYGQRKRRKTMKKKSKSHRTAKRASRKREVKHRKANPTHALGLGRRFLRAGSKSEIEKAAKLARAMGKKPRVKKIPSHLRAFARKFA